MWHGGTKLWVERTVGESQGRSVVDGIGILAT